VNDMYKSNQRNMFIEQRIGNIKLHETFFFCREVIQVLINKRDYYLLFFFKKNDLTLINKFHACSMSNAIKQLVNHLSS
jgi:hypothetical protein